MERFLGRTEDQIKSIALQTVEGHLRAIVGTLSVEDIYKNRDVFAQKVQEVSAGASKITKDVTNIIAQLPPVIEALSGIKLEDLVAKLPKLAGEDKK